MPVQKYRSIEDMPPPPQPADETMAERLKRIALVWDRAERLAPRRARRPGVRRFRSVDDPGRDLDSR